MADRAMGLESGVPSVAMEKRKLAALPETMVWLAPVAARVKSDWAGLVVAPVPMMVWMEAGSS